MPKYGISKEALPIQTEEKTKDGRNSFNLISGFPGGKAAEA